LEEMQTTVNIQGACLALVEKLVRSHTNLVLRESLDDTLHHLLPWDIELIIDEPVDQTEEEPEV
jgi:hypothetical protein